MMKKPNQIIDEIKNVIYPPAEAVVNQLNTIKAIIPSTVKMYQSTEDIHTIQPNLDMIQRAIDYLRGAPMIDDLKPAPEDVLKPVFTIASSGFNVFSNFDKNGEYNVTVVGLDVDPEITHKELFGKVDFNATEFGITIPVTCGKTYLVTQESPVLEYYKDDPTISEIDGIWTKEKTYYMDEDFFTYAFLLVEGRTEIKVVFSEEDNPNPIVMNITTHIHFKQKEEEEPPIIEEPKPEEPENPELTEGENNSEDNSFNG